MQIIARTHTKPLSISSSTGKEAGFKARLRQESKTSYADIGQPTWNPLAQCSTDYGSTSAPAEDPAERMERLSKGRKAKPMEIRGVNQMSQEEKDLLDNPYNEWNEGKLFPEGWEQMSLPGKVAEIYLGRRGILFWMNKLAYASVFVLIGLWILFRFVGPNLGFYKLAGDLMPPPV
eukprot:gene20301-27059_t